MAQRCASPPRSRHCRLEGPFRANRTPRALPDSCCSAAYPSRFTIVRAVRALPAGSWLMADRRGAGEPTRYFSIAAAWRDAARSDDALDDDASAEAIRAALRDSVVNHQVADVPVGAFLSAGIDSGALVGLMTEAGTPPATVTVAFDEFAGKPEDESPLAAKRRGALRRCAQHLPRDRRRIPGRLAGHSDRHGPTQHRRRQHLVRRQGRPRPGPQGSRLRPRWRRALRRLSQLHRYPPLDKFVPLTIPHPRPGRRNQKSGLFPSHQSPVTNHRLPKSPCACRIRRHFPRCLAGAARPLHALGVADADGGGAGEGRARSGCNPCPLSARP